jgi:hypothetical protein
MKADTTAYGVVGGSTSPAKGSSILVKEMMYSTEPIGLEKI